MNSHSVQAQAKLTIGDAAPGIRYSKWLKGTPVNSMNDDKLYVLEFWATWCGPCIAAMPHLSELSEKYKEQAVFIGVNVLEKTGEKPYESALPNVERFVNSSANRMKYNVIADNNAQDMYNGWMKAAGIGGIPTTFVVHKQKIVWIGHPIKLDSVIPPILDGTYDMAAHKKVYDKDAGAQVKMMKELEEARASIKAAVEKKDFDGAFKLIDES
ncbi:MAG TPA: TlpA disulfide reductase family protein, partial [Pseudobacter sp.]|nr:TlpA disulfide reductase family protein [Pseudobacter sp.]